MLRHLYHYATLTDPTNSYQDAQLSLELTDYFANVFGTAAPTFAQIAEKFSRQVLIQPVVAGQEQQDHRGLFDPEVCMSDGCWFAGAGEDPICDIYNCDMYNGYSADLGAQVDQRLNQVATLRSVLGVNPATIEWMGASARTTAYGRSDGLDDATEMTATFGTLGPDDAFYVPFSGAVLEGYAGARLWYSPGAGLQSAFQFAANTHYGVETFITVARHDALVFTPSIPYGIDHLVENTPEFAELLAAVGYSALLPYYDLPRPGLMALFYTPAYGGTEIRMAMPHTYESGHTVTMRAPAELKADVQHWLNHIYER